MKDLMLLINPNAGREGYRTGLGEVLRIFHEAGYLTTVFFTEGPGDAARLAAENAGNFERVVCVGGDGTLSETISGLMQCPSRPALGYLPMGTANDCAATLGLSRNPVTAARTAAYGRTLDLDVGRFGDNGYFAYVAAFGAFTEVSYETPHEQKQALGHLAYVLWGMAALGRLTHRRVRVEYDGGVLEDDFIFGGVTNSTSLAGLVKLPDAADVELSDGLFEVVLVKNPAGPAQAGAVIMDVLASNLHGEYVTLLHSRKVRFIFDEPAPWTRDGEAGGKYGDLTLENIHAPIKILVD